MNLALFLEQPFDPEAGGVQRSTSKLALIFKEKGHQVIIISSSITLSKVSTWHDIPIFHVNIETGSLFFRQLLKKEKISLIINQAGYSVPLTKFLINNKFGDLKIINTLRINPLNFYDNYKDFVGNFLNQKKLGFLNNILSQKLLLGYHILKQRYELNYIIKHTNAFVMLSERFKPELYFLAPHLKKYNEKIHGISNPFTRPQIDIQATVQAKENIILYVGRIDIIQKRVDLLMRIWQKLHETLPDWKFWVVGEGESKAFMENYCVKNKLDRVTFFGKDDPTDYYKKAKIFHLTSAFEGFGNVLVEAQSYGCVPILFNSYSAAQDIVNQDVDGLLIEPFHINQYVDETISLIRNPEKLSDMALNSFENVNSFSYDQTYSKWNSVFKSLK